jgi:hypothetical protein
MPENKFRIILTSVLTMLILVSMKTHTLSIRAFPYDINKALKIQAAQLDRTFRDHVITILASAAQSKVAKKEKP